MSENYNSKIIVLVDNNIKSISQLKDKNPYDKKIEDKFNFLITLYRQCDNTFIKTYILENLIKIFPKNYNLYFLMGYTFKDTDHVKSISYYKKCYDINKNYLDNTSELCRMLFLKGEYSQIIDIITKNYKQDLLNNEPRLKSTLAYSYIKSKQYIKGEKLMVELVDLIDKDKNNSLEINLSIGILNNTSHMYGDLNKYEKSVFYLNKAISILQKNENKKLEKDNIYIYSNLLVYHDYLNKSYSENKYIYDRINHLYETETDNVKTEKNNKINKKKKIGYVSSDFVKHAVSNFILPIIYNHDLEKYNICLFDNSEKESNHILLKSELQKMGKGNKIKIYNISKLNTKQVCELIKKEEIDILFDLNGHTDGNRLDVFVEKPSPIQVSYIGYPNTTGLKTIDYRIVDKITDKYTNQEHYSEKLVFLEKCFLLYNSYQQQYPVNIIDNGEQIILGSMNRENKNSKEVLKLWKNILKKCKEDKEDKENKENNLGSKVKILIKVNGSDEETLLERKNYYKNILEISDKNIIIVSASMSTEEYFNTFGKIDVLLDTFPYSGTTTSCNALYNSTPIVTLYKDKGNSHCQNVTSSLLIHSGLEDLVAYSEEEYIEKVVDLCRNKSKIYEYKNKIHSLFNNCMNAKNFMKEYEKIIDNIDNFKIY